MKSSKLLTLAAITVLISSSTATVVIDWVDVGDPGNQPYSYNLGAVAYSYRIGKYEVTNAQYGEFLNAKAASDPYNLYSDFMSSDNPIGSGGIERSGSSGSYSYTVTSDLANRPVASISWFSAARFANWMNNGQGNGDTETGSYTLNGALSGIIIKNSGAQIYIPSESEWVKAAYYNPVTQSYSYYPTGKETWSSSDANYNLGAVVDVGTYSDSSFYGTFDQAGNVQEWNDYTDGTKRGMRGSWFIGGPDFARIDVPGSQNPAFGNKSMGFRLASVAVPEPSAMVLTMLASGVMLVRRRR